MATPTAIAIRQETAAARIEAAAARLGIDGRIASHARDAETRIAELLEHTAALVEAIALTTPAPIAEPTQNVLGSTPEADAPARRSKPK